MGRHQLHRHPDSSVQPQLIVKTGMRLRPGGGYLLLNFIVYGAVDMVMWPDHTLQGRTDMLWQHSCFEAFIQSDGSTAYTELNFAPGRQWAAYVFDDYRSGMRNEVEVSIYRMDWMVRDLSVQRAEMHVLVELPTFSRSRALHVGLSAVLEAKDGTKSYWALSHAPGPPDFHNRACWTARLPARAS